MPKPARRKKRPPETVTHVDFRFTSAAEFWNEVVLRAHSRFLGHQSRQHAIEAAWAAWHLHEWIWHDMRPSRKASGADYTTFRDGLLAACPQLSWMRDVADAAKHRGLGRRSAEPPALAGIGRQEGEVPSRPFGMEPANIGTPLRIHVTGTDHDFVDALERVIGWWRTHHFPS